MLTIRQKLAQTAKRAGLLSGGLLLCLVGAGFLTFAGWIALSALIGGLNTALVFAALYLGIGLIMMGAAVHRAPRLSHDAAARPQSPGATKQSLLDAFLYGMQAGAKADQARR
jgi:hypothetical protein